MFLARFSEGVYSKARRAFPPARADRPVETVKRPCDYLWEIQFRQ